MNALKKCIKSCSRLSTNHEVNRCEMHCNKKYLQAAEDEVKHHMAEIAFRIAKSNVRDPHKKFMEDVNMGRKSPKRKSSKRKAKRKHYSRK
jgi:hypothetical protein